jgi:hypothetical protein
LSFDNTEPPQRTPLRRPYLALQVEPFGTPTPPASPSPPPRPTSIGLRSSPLLNELLGLPSEPVGPAHVSRSTTDSAFPALPSDPFGLASSTRVVSVSGTPLASTYALPSSPGTLAGSPWRSPPRIPLDSDSGHSNQGSIGRLTTDNYTGEPVVTKTSLKEVPTSALKVQSNASYKAGNPSRDPECQQSCWR